MLITIEDLLTAEQLKQIRAMLQSATFTDGKLTAGQEAKKVKNNEQLTYRDDIGKKASEFVMGILRSDQRVANIALIKSILPIMFSRYKEGMHYGIHLDNPLLGEQGRIRTDISMTIFLNEPSEYEGGELVIETDFGVKVSKEKAGNVILYPSNTLHEVTPVTKGERLVAISWIQSMIKDTTQRRLLFDLATLSTQLIENNRSEAKTAKKCYYNLLRMWAEV